MPCRRGSARIGRLLLGVALSMLSLSLPAFAQAPLPAQQYADLGNVKLQSGRHIQSCKLGFRTMGSLNAKKSNAVLVPTWFDGNSGQLAATLRNDPLFDPSPYFVILVDSLGNGVSCSPSNSAAQHGPAFPQFTIRDMVESEYRLVRERLRLSHLHAVVGFSMGGFQTFQWIVSHPSFMDVAASIEGTPRMTSYDMLLFGTMEQAVLADPAYAGGNYTKSPVLPVAHLIFNMNLFTPEYRVRTTSLAQFPGFFAEARKAEAAFDANDWRWQIRAILRQDIAPGGSLAEAAGKVRAHMLVINDRQDHTVNPAPALAFARLVHAETLVLESDCGHEAPFCEPGAIRPKVDALLRSPSQPAGGKP
jgi:homoserine O-acetyltransferase/O-succinyltransferase